MKELHLTEGRNTGFKKIIDAIRDNGSPMPEFETDDDHSYFISRIFIHEEFKKENEPDNTENEVLNSENEPDELKNEVLKSKNEVLKSKNEPDKTKNEVLESKNEVLNSENEVLNSENEVLNSENEVLNRIAEYFNRMTRKKAEKIIIEIYNNNYITITQIAEKTKIPKSTVDRYISVLKNKGLLKREGTKMDGKWNISTNTLVED